MERKTLNRLSTTFSAILLAGCINTVPEATRRPTPTPEKTDPTPDLLFPIQDGYITGGPHWDGLSNGVRYALDFAGKNVARCPGSLPLTDVDVVASASGTVINIEDKSKRHDPFHSTVEVQGKDGLILGYMHLDNIAVELGEEVERGEFLGHPSCEISPGGDTKGVHLHQYLKDGEGNPLPIEGTVYEGFTVKNSQDNYQGILVKGDDIRTADKRRCGPKTETINACNGIRNDLTDVNPYAEATPKPVLSEIFKPSTESPVLGAKQKILSLWAETWRQDYSFSFNSSDIDDKNRANFDATNYIKVSPSLNLDSWYAKERDNLYDGGTESILTLNFDISFEEFKKDQASVKRYYGQMETKNIKLSVASFTSSLTRDERNLGITWKGQAYADYQWRFKSMRISKEGQKQEIEKWIRSNPDEKLPKFGAWQNSQQVIELALQNGEWILRKTLINQPDTNPWEFINAGREEPMLKLPFDIRLYCDTYRREECQRYD